MQILIISGIDESSDTDSTSHDNTTVKELFELIGIDADAVSSTTRLKP